MRILVAGVGNVLKGDDGFGVHAAKALATDPRLPDSTTVLETGIGGMHLVQELMQGYDAVILLDAVDRGGQPGQLFLLEAELPELASLTDTERRAHTVRAIRDLLGPNGLVRRLVVIMVRSFCPLKD